MTTDGRRLFAASDDRTVRVWDVAAGHLLHTLRGHAGPVNAVAVSADGQAIVSASEDETLRVWDAGGLDCRVLREASAKSLQLFACGTRRAACAMPRALQSVLGQIDAGFRDAALDAHEASRLASARWLLKRMSRRKTEPLVAGESAKLQVLRRTYPRHAQEELLRFCTGKPQTAPELLRAYAAYLEWRQGPGSTGSLTTAAAAVAPEFIRHIGAALDDGTPAIYCQGPRYDEAHPPETYVRATCHVVDAIIAATRAHRVTTLIDIRIGDGWPNPKAQALYPFFKSLGAHFTAYYPHLSSRLILYPLPRMAEAVFNVVRKALPVHFRTNVVVLEGLDNADDPAPEGLWQYVCVGQFPPDAQPRHQRHRHQTIA